MLEAYNTAIDDVMDSVQRIRDAKASITLEKERLSDVVKALAGRIESRDLLIDAAAFLYWEVPEIAVESIAWAVTDTPFAHKLLAVIPKRGKTECRGCGGTIWRNSRSARAEEYCPICVESRNNANRAHWELQALHEECRRGELRDMPYREYLRSPEWQETRAARLKAARFSCQVCNTSRARLNVHHRTYERRGHELASDLIVLCEDCHRLFHEQGKLAKGE